jgi:mannose-6-phosphate isomerase-like protein (cupin superfamily)
MIRARQRPGCEFDQQRSIILAAAPCGQEDLVKARSAGLVGLNAQDLRHHLADVLLGVKRRALVVGANPGTEREKWNVAATFALAPVVLLAHARRYDIIHTLGSTHSVYTSILTARLLGKKVVIASNNQNVGQGDPRPMVVGVTWVLEQNEENLATARAYLAGQGQFPQRAALNQLPGRFLTEFYVTVARWIDWASAIVDTPDALLVADRAKAQDVSTIVARLRQANRKEHAQHLRNYRPWGYFDQLSVGPRFQVKLLHVNPGAKLSMQMHHHRSEHWVVVHGTAKITVGGEEKLVRENESVYIVATEWHRLENPGKTPLELIEVQIGGYLGEDDITRSEDAYNRGPEETK